MNTTSVMTEHYEQKPLFLAPAKQRQFKPNFKLFAGEVIQKKLCFLTAQMGNLSQRGASVVCR